MQLAPLILLIIHVVAAITWVGAVFMNTFIDWPSARRSVPDGQFPFRFIMEQGKRVFYAVYTGIAFTWVSGIGLIVLKPPQTSDALLMVGGKLALLLLMTGITLYGTFSSWHKLQTSTHTEALQRHRPYIFRSRAIYVLGIIASVVGVILSRS